jgi:Family of unknown function (DUF6639)
MPALVLGLMCCLLATPAFAADQERHCVKPLDVVVEGASPETVVEVCSATARALTYLSQFNLRPKRTILFDLTEESIANGGLPAYGRYDSRSDRIELMSYVAIRDKVPNSQMFGEPFDKVHYAGVVAHEVAHAVMQHNLKTVLISPMPQEYLAYATQLAVLPESRRQRILKALDVTPWQSGDVISDVYLGIEPDKFAAKSYLHLTALADPTAFVEILLNAKWFYIYVP